MRGTFFLLLSLWLHATAVSAPSLPASSPGSHSVSFCDEANEWPPYTYYRRVAGERSKELTGFTVELLRLIAARRGFVLRIDMLPWKRCVEMVRSGVITAMLNAISTPERERDFLVSDVLYETRLLYLWSRRQKPGGVRIQNQADLAALRVGGVHGYSYSQLDLINQNALVRAPNYGSLVQMLHRDRIDVLLVGEEVFQSLSSLGGYDFAGDTELGRAPLPVREPNRFHMLFSRKNPRGAELQALVNREIEALQRSGELRALLARHVGADPAPP